MKNHNQTWHRFISFVERELEMSLAVLLVLACAIGYGFANSATLDSGDVSVQEATGSNLMINRISYDGIDFTSRNIPNLYRVYTGITPGDVATTVNGTRGFTNGMTYTYKLTLDQPVSGTFYMHGDYTNSVSVNGTVLNSPAGAAVVSGSQITIQWKSGDTIEKLVTYPGTASSVPPAATVKDLYIIPSAASITVGMNRFFQIVALDENGRSVSNVAVVWSITQGNRFATINASTGRLTANQAGGPVTVQAKVSSKTATATITVKESTTAALQDIIDSIQPQREDQSTSSAPATGGESTPADSATSISQTNEALLDQLAEEKSQALTERGNTYLDEEQVQKVIEKAPTTAQKITTKLSLGLQQVAQDIQEILVGRNVQTETGETVRILSVWERVGRFVANLFGFGGSTGEIGGASPLRSGFGEEGELE